MNRNIFLGLLLLPLLLACQSTQVKNFKSAKDVSNISEEESRLWIQAKKFDESLEKRDALYKDPATVAYIQSIIDRMFPAFRGKIRVRLLKDPTMNAFALPNGSLYFNIGLVARFDNEAQLATVLAHEVGHFVKKHGFRQRRNIKTASSFGLILGAAGGGIFAQLLAMSSVYGYSRDLERDADRFAYTHIRKAGYDIRQTRAAFEKLLAEVKANKSKKRKRRVFFASHPKLQERIDSFSTLIKKHNGTTGETGHDRYLVKTRNLRIVDLETNLSFGRVKSVILILENKSNRYMYPAWADYYLGEAYRRRAKKGDINKAYSRYLAAVSAAPKFAPTYRALGVYYMKKKRYRDAKKSFTRFLTLAPNHKRAAYVRQYLKIVNKEMQK